MCIKLVVISIFEKMHCTQTGIKSGLKGTTKRRIPLYRKLSLNFFNVLHKKYQNIEYKMIRYITKKYWTINWYLLSACKIKFVINFCIIFKFKTTRAWTRERLGAACPTYVKLHGIAPPRVYADRYCTWPQGRI